MAQQSVKPVTKFRLFMSWCYIMGFCAAFGATWPIVYCWRYYQGRRVSTKADETTILSLARTYDKQLYPIVQGFVSTFYNDGSAHFTYMRLPHWHPALSKTIISSGHIKLVLITHV